MNSLDDMGHTPLHLAIQYGSTSVIEQLVDYGADVNAKDSSDLTPLYMTIMYRDYFDVPSSTCPKLKKVCTWFGTNSRVRSCVPPIATDTHYYTCANEDSLIS